MADGLDVHLQWSLVSPERRFALDVRFTAPARRMGLLGPSGAGKSATLRALAGLSRPERGHIRLGDRVLFDAAAGIHVPARARRIGMVFQDYALFPHLTVEQNLHFAVARLGQAVSAEAAARIGQLLRQFDLLALRRDYPRNLSGGQRQRVAVARALATQPQLLLLDEPFSALDGALRERLRGELAQMLQTVDIPMVLVTHDARDLQALADGVVHMAQGRVVQGVASLAAGDLA